MKKLASLVLIFILSSPLFGQEKMDLLFLIDSSSSMNFSDPQNFRNIAVKAFIDITQDRGGDRIGIYQFAGWSETSRRGAVVWPMTAIPSDPEARTALLSRIKKTIDKKIVAFGRATDFNFALSKCIEGALKNRNGRKLWIILFSDGEMSVASEYPIRKAYKTLAKKLYGTVAKETLGKAALYMFKTQTLPRLQRKDVYVTPVYLLRSGTNKNEILDYVASKTQGPPRALESSRENLRNVFLRALTSPPGHIYRPQFTRTPLYQKKEIPGESPWRDSIYIYEGTRSTKILVFSSQKNFSLQLLNDRGDPYSPSENLSIVGDGEAYRILSLNHFPPGSYTLQVKNLSEKKAHYERLIFYEFQFSPYLKLVQPQTVFYPGKEINVEVGLTYGQAFVRDKQFIHHLFGRVYLQKKGQSRHLFTQKLSFVNQKKSLLSLNFPLKANLEKGTYWLVFQAQGLPTKKGVYAFSAPPIKTAIEVRLALEVEFSKKQAFLSVPLEVRGRKRGQFTLSECPITLVHQSGKKVPLVLEATGDPSRYKAEFRPLQKGKWTIEKATKPLDILSTGTLEVWDRNFSLLASDKNGKFHPAKTIPLSLPTGEDKSYFETKIQIKSHLPAGEKGEVTLEIRSARPLGSPLKAKFFAGKLALAQGKTTFRGSESREVVIHLSSQNLGELAGSPLQLILHGTSKQGAIRQPFDLEITYNPPLPTYFYWMGGAVLLLLLLALFAFSRARFDGHQLIPLHLIEEERETYYLKSQARGLLKNKSPCFPDCPQKALLHIRGCRWLSPVVWGRKTDPESSIFSKGNTLLSHGSTIDFDHGDDHFRYLYFDREPSEEERQRLIHQFDPGIYLGDDEYVIVEEYNLKKP